MGNSLHGVSLPSHGKYSNRVDLGINSAMFMTGSKAIERGQLVENWKVSYFVNGSNCELYFKKHLDHRGNVKKASFLFQHDICIGKVICVSIIPDSDTDPVRMTTFLGDESPLLNELHVGNPKPQTFFYGVGNMGGLVVLELKANVVTVAHYYTAILKNYFNQTMADIGLSVIAKIRLSNNGNLDVKVEGPTPHNFASLCYMFREVKRTGSWKATMCPHCAHNQRERADVSSLIESEDSESLLPSSSSPPPPPQHHGPGQNTKSIIANQGTVSGNYNGSLILSLFKALLGLEKKLRREK